MNTGDCIIACGIAMIDPGAPNATPKPAPGAGAVATGSGNVDRPCARMHLDIASIASFWVSEACPWTGPPFGNSFEHADWADWKAGDWGLIPEPIGNWRPPPPPGSGKLGTPCERMHCANLIPALPLEADWLFDLPDDPHAFSATAQPTARAAARARCRPGLAADVVVCKVVWWVAGDTGF